VWVALALTSIKQWREAVLDSLRQVEGSPKPVFKIPAKNRWKELPVQHSP